MIKSTSFSVAQDETRPILQGVLFEIKDKSLNLVALDGYRLAVKSELLMLKVKSLLDKVFGRLLKNMLIKLT